VGIGHDPVDEVIDHCGDAIDTSVTFVKSGRHRGIALESRECGVHAQRRAVSPHCRDLTGSLIVAARGHDPVLNAPQVIAEALNVPVGVLNSRHLQAA
jgi:hypothetical protein